MRGSVIHRRGLAKKKGGVGPAYHEKCAAHFRTEPAAPAYLGA